MANSSNVSNARKTRDQRREVSGVVAADPTTGTVFGMAAPAACECHRNKFSRALALTVLNFLLCAFVSLWFHFAEDGITTETQRHVDDSCVRMRSLAATPA